jgi:peptidoglycan hydrolase CwlO-like protein
MNIERKMDFIVENLAALTVSQQKTDRQMRGLQTLVKTGMRMLIDLQRAQKRTDERMAELAESQKELAAQQKRTDEKFERWLNSLNQGTNGHKKKPN